jgi:hypothetical protein
LGRSGEVSERLGEVYKGLEYEQIVTRLLFKLGYGDAPVEGERNETLYTVSRYMRYICDFNAEWLFQALPHWGLSDHEVMATIKSAVASARPQSMPSLFRELLDSMLAEVQEQESVDKEEEDDGLSPKVPKKLPGILQTIIDHTPDEFKEASLFCTMPILGTLATGVRAEYNDGKINSPSFITSVWGPGNFLALKVSDFDARADKVLIGLDPSVSSGLADIKADPDHNGIFKISDKGEQKLVVVTQSGDHATVKRYDLSGLTLQTAGA